MDKYNKELLKTTIITILIFCFIALTPFIIVYFTIDWEEKKITDEKNRLNKEIFKLRDEKEIKELEAELKRLQKEKVEVEKWKDWFLKKM